MTANVAASVRARLRNKMHDTGLDFQFLLARYACERFLYRLGASPMRDRCILKGASLLAAWMDEPYRATRDVDVLALDGADEPYVRQVVATICGVPCPEDGITFDLDSLSISPIRTAQEHPNQRVTLTARLENARILLQVDVCFGDVVIPEPEEVQFPTLINGMVAPSLRAYPRASSVAEKFEAIVQLGQQNSRMKDFHDIWALSETFSFDGSQLREAIHACFVRRGTDWTTLTPHALTSTFYSNAALTSRWRDYRSSTDLLSPPPGAFELVGERIRNFLEPIRESMLTGAPFAFDWLPGGPWYRDTGVAWLGKVPRHWDVKPLKLLLSRNDGGVWGHDSEDNGVIVLRSTEQTVDGEWRIEEPAVRRLTPSEFEACRLIEGDLVVTKSSGSARHIGKTSIVTGEVEALNCCFSNFMQRFRTKGSLISRFAWYVLNGESTRNQFNSISGTTTGLANLNGEIMGMVNIACPPVYEQHTIVSFLDQEVAKIDALVAKKARLIVLLQEKRNAVITHAVTKGLDPNLPMKDSGIDGIGDIPGHWDLVEIRRRWIVIDCKHVTVPFVIGGIPLASVRETQSFQLDLSDAKCTTDEWYELLIEGGRRPRPGDLIYCRNVSVGAAALVTTEDQVAMGQDVCLLRSSLDNPRWLNYYLCSSAMSHQLAAVAKGSTFDRINISDIKSLFVPTVPQYEQEQISRFLDCEVAKIDALVKRVLEAIARLRELRTALISAAVTGKIDVGKAAA